MQDQPQRPHEEAPTPPRPRPCTLVLFGATGDLVHRLVMPAIYNMARAGDLPDRFAILGVARGEDDAAAWGASLKESLIRSRTSGGEGAQKGEALDERVWDELQTRLDFLQGDLTDEGLYAALDARLAGLARDRGVGPSVIFYLAVADALFGPVAAHLARAGLFRPPGEAHAPSAARTTPAQIGDPKGAGATEGLRTGDAAQGRAPFRRLVVEKPFGHSLQSARDLNAALLEVLEEDQIFRIDHFLGKDTVQNILAVRFANGVFEPLWSRDHIDHVQITAAETVGVEGRGDFYEKTGALRDMVPNHLFSLLSLIAMEPPTGFDAEAVRNRKADVLAAMPAADPSKAVRGQYGPGAVDGETVCGYREEKDVSRTSPSETYIALRVEVDNWRWSGVPFFLRTGKHLAMRVTEIAIRFKPAPLSIFRETPVEAVKPNWLIIRIAPDEGMSLEFEVKRPGPLEALAPARMEFRYDQRFGRAPAVGYETLLYDVMTGDQTLFMRADMEEHGWRVVEPVLNAFASEPPDFPNYASGGSGPADADALIGEQDGWAWRALTKSGDAG